MRLDHLLSEKKGWMRPSQPRPSTVVDQQVQVLQTKWPPRPPSLIFRSLCLPYLNAACFRVGGIAQLARASALQAEGQGFESPCLHESEGFLQYKRRDWKNDMVK